MNIGTVEDQFDIEGQVLNIYNACRRQMKIETRLTVCGERWNR
ncbi:MAG: hypothetical protein U5R06_08405 [candidate division KSB1 bacterium]|nr:hypothetical protein [candidate division KSB1 bacterium]